MRLLLLSLLGVLGLLSWIWRTRYRLTDREPTRLEALKVIVPPRSPEDV